MHTYLTNNDPTTMDTILANMDEHHQTVHHMFPFNCMCKPWPVDRVFLQICYRGTLQFMILKPVVTLLAVIMEYNGIFNEGSFSFKYGYIYTSIIMNFSITWAAYVLLQFYLVFKIQLKPYSPVPKFLCIKAILFLSFWQAVVLAGFAQFQLIHDVGEYTSADVKTGINNLLLCIEMVLIAVAHKSAFPYAQYHRCGGGSSSSSKEDSLGTSLLNDNFATTDLLRDVNDSGMSIVVPTGFKPSAKDVVKHGRNQTNEETSKEKEDARDGVGVDSKMKASTSVREEKEDNEGWRM